MPRDCDAPERQSTRLPVARSERARLGRSARARCAVAGSAAATRRTRRRRALRPRQAWRWEVRAWRFGCRAARQRLVPPRPSRSVRSLRGRGEASQAHLELPADAVDELLALPVMRVAQRAVGSQACRCDGPRRSDANAGSVQRLQGGQRLLQYRSQSALHRRRIVRQPQVLHPAPGQARHKHFRRSNSACYSGAMASKHVAHLLALRSRLQRDRNMSTPQTRSMTLLLRSSARSEGSQHNSGIVTLTSPLPERFSVVRIG